MLSTSVGPSSRATHRMMRLAPGGLVDSHRGTHIPRSTTVWLGGCRVASRLPVPHLRVRCDRRGRRDDVRLTRVRRHLRGDAAAIGQPGGTVLSRSCPSDGDQHCGRSPPQVGRSAAVRSRRIASTNASQLRRAGLRWSRFPSRGAVSPTDQHGPNDRAPSASRSREPDLPVGWWRRQLPNLLRFPPSVPDRPGPALPSTVARSSLTWRRHDPRLRSQEGSASACVPAGNLGTVVMMTGPARPRPPSPPPHAVTVRPVGPSRR